MMPQNKYGTLKNNTQMTATATLATTSSIRVESATQSDGIVFLCRDHLSLPLMAFIQ